MAAPVEERVSRLEGAYDHLATKGDIGNLKTDIANLKTDLASLESRLLWRFSTMWFVGLAAVTAILRLT